MDNLSKLSLKKSLSRDELKQIKGKATGDCYCQDNSNWGPGFILPGSCESNHYPSFYTCRNI